MVLLDNLIENKTTNALSNMSLAELYKTYKELMYNIKELGGIYDESVLENVDIVRSNIQNKLCVIACSIEKEDLIKMLTERFKVKRIHNRLTFSKAFIFDDYELSLEVSPVLDVKYSRFKFDVCCKSKATPDFEKISFTLLDRDLPNILSVKRIENCKIKVVVGDNYVIADCLGNISNISNIQYYYRDTFINNIN